MLRALILILLVAATPVLALESPFESSVEGLDIPNSHYVNSDDEEGLLIRGMMPRSQKDARQLYNLGVEHILIFKKSSGWGESKGQDIEEEKVLLESVGYSRSQVTHLDFPWKGLDTAKKKREACENIVAAIALMEEKVDEGNRLFYHCTVGEDRTGLLTGLYRIKNHGWSPREAFYFEMCENGYEHGNYRKPYHPVVLPIRESLTPLYWEMAYVLTERPERWGLNMCRDLGKDWQYRKNWKAELQFLMCPASSKYPYEPEN